MELKKVDKPLPHVAVHLSVPGWFHYNCELFQKYNSDSQSQPLIMQDLILTALEMFMDSSKGFKEWLKTNNLELRRPVTVAFAKEKKSTIKQLSVSDTPRRRGRPPVANGHDSETTATQ